MNLYQRPSLPKMDGCREEKKLKVWFHWDVCQTAGKVTKSIWSLWWKTFWEFSYRSFWNGASIFGIEMSGWLTCTWNQRAALMICIYRQGAWVQSFRDGSATEGEGYELCSLADAVKEMTHIYADCVREVWGINSLIGLWVIYSGSTVFTCMWICWIFQNWLLLVHEVLDHFWRTPLNCARSFTCQSHIRKKVWITH